MFHKRFLAPLADFSSTFDTISFQIRPRDHPAMCLIARRLHPKNLPYCQRRVTSATDLTRAGGTGRPTHPPRDLAGHTNYDIRTMVWAIGHRGACLFVYGPSIDVASYPRNGRSPVTTVDAVVPCVR